MDEHEQHDFVYRYGNFTIEFYWRPYVDADASTLVSGWLQHNPMEQFDLILIGIGTWHLLKEAGDPIAAKSAILNEYQSAFQNLSLLLNALDKHVPVIWLAQGPADFLRVPWAQKPTVHSMSDYNAVAEAALKGTNVTYWRSAFQVANAFFGQSSDFIHYPLNLTDRLINIFLNYYCNLRMDESSETHCCSAASSSFGVQRQALSARAVVLEILMIALVAMGLTCRWCAVDVPPRVSSILSSAHSMLLLCSIVLLCYAFERLSVAKCSEKPLSALNLYLPCLLVALLACLSTAESSKASILNRDQTDEWKGWMQLFIVICHVTGYSRNIVISMNMRFLVSSYLVLTGYGHFMFYVQGGSITFSRVIQVVVRLNFLCAILCIVMKQPYQFYSFIPLVTFWYLVICFILLLPPRVTQESLAEHPREYLALCFKLLVVASGVATLHASEVLFDKVFSVPIWRRFFVTSDGSLSSWRFRWSLDRFSALSGIVLGMVAHAVGRNTVEMPNWLLYALSAVAAAGVFLPTGLGWTCANIQHCDEIHPMLFFIAVASFVYLRNITEALRQRYSWIMAQCGRISLELFLLQQHLWLCGELHRVLQVLPWPLLNETLLAFLLIAASSVTHAATESLMKLLFKAKDADKVDLR